MAAYDGQWKAHDGKAASERLKRLATVSDPLISMVAPLSGKTVVDLGMGAGTLAFRALELSPPETLIGIDFSIQGLRVAREISSAPALRDRDIELVRGDLENIPLARRSVDVIISQATLNLIPDKRAVFSEISRVARSGARVAVSDAFRTTVSSDEGSWEKCVRGAMTVTEFSTYALNAGLIILNQVDLTQKVKGLVSGKKWDWPEFLEHNMDYRAFLMMRS